jgi:hypothetical protein
MFDTVTLPTPFVVRHKLNADHTRHAAELEGLDREIRMTPKPVTVLVRALKPTRVCGRLIEVGKYVDVIDDASLAALIATGIVERT